MQGGISPASFVGIRLLVMPIELKRLHVLIAWDRYTALSDDH